MFFLLYFFCFFYFSPVLLCISLFDAVTVANCLDNVVHVQSFNAPETSITFVLFLLLVVRSMSALFVLRACAFLRATTLSKPLVGTCFEFVSGEHRTQL